ncbi:MAG: alkaline phosphatase [Clostridia bacterium]|nr:alkaline phosphatase [Clostridia bacterium]
MKKRILALLLAIVIILPFAVACGNGGAESDGADTTVAPDIEVTTTGPDVTTSTPDTTEPDNSLLLTPDESTDYQIVVSSTASTSLYSAAENLGKALGRLWNCEALPVVRDYTSPAENEIVIGSTTRGYSSELFASLRELDYAVATSESDIYLVGGSYNKTIEAMEYFANSVEAAGDAGYKLDPDEPYYCLADYPIRTVTVDGVDLRNYTLVIPAEQDPYVIFATEIFNDFLAENAGYTLKRTSDASAPSQYEILIGATNRTESKTEKTFSVGQYSLSKSGDKIVCLGDNQFVAGGLSVIIQNLPLDGENQNVNITGLATEIAPKAFEFKKAESAVLLIGDGMGFNSILSAKIAGKVTDFSGYHLPYQGESKTDSVSGVTDSAAGGTALACGYKTVNGYLGVDRNKKAIPNVRALADNVGAKTAILTTDAITGATPGAFMVHHDNRNDTAIIQEQIDLLLADGYLEYAKGSVGDTLLSETKTALKTISAGESRFFMMIEEGYIDKHSHSNNFEGMFSALSRFDKTIMYVSTFTVMNPETVMIITADHETGGIKCSEELGVYRYTSTSHTGVNVPILAMGAGTEVFNGQAVENIEIAKFLAAIFSTEKFGQ